MRIKNKKDNKLMNLLNGLFFQYTIQGISEEMEKFLENLTLDNSGHWKSTPQNQGKEF